MNNWMTIAPIDEYYDNKNVFSKPFCFDNSLSIQKIPDWINDKSITKYMSHNQKEILTSKSQLAITLSYQANSLGDPDPSWKGDSPRSIQSIAVEKINFLNLALWLSKPTLINFSLVIHAQETNGSWIFRQSFIIQTLRIHERDELNKIEIQDLVLAKKTL